MDDQHPQQQPNASETPDYLVKREEVAALRPPPGQELRPASTVTAFSANEPIVIEPVTDSTSPPRGEQPVIAPAPTDAMPGDAAPTPLIPLKDDVAPLRAPREE